MTLLGLTSQPVGEGLSSGAQGILNGIATPQPKGNESVPLVAPQMPTESNSEPALLPGEVRGDGVGAGATGAIAGEALTKVMEEAATHDRGNQAAHNGGEAAGSPGTHSHAAELLGKPTESTVAPDATPAAPKVTPAPPETAPVVPSHGRETMQILFEPGDMGQVRMQVSILAHEVHATVSVQHQGLGEYLANSQGALDDQLRQHGLRVEEFQVNTDPGRAGQGQDPTQFQGRENTEPTRRSEPTESPTLLRDAVEGESESVTSLLRINTFA
jgi:flagellar hook-length control protein FliK